MDVDPASHSRRARHRRRADRSKLRGGAACFARRPAMKDCPVTITGLGAIAERFDNVLLDQWGTLHEGKTFFLEEIESVAHIRLASTRGLLISRSCRRVADTINTLV